MNRTTRLETHAVDVTRRIATEQTARSGDKMREYSDMKIDRRPVDGKWHPSSFNHSNVRGTPLRGSVWFMTH